MELNHLQTFIVVAEEGNVTRAAERLFMTPSSVSAHIKALEDELNVVLFVRKPQGMEITDHGNILRARAESIVRGAQDMVELSAKLQASLIGKVRIGLNTGFKFLRVAELITRVRQSYPKVDLVFESTSTGRIFPGLRERTLDAGFIFGDAPDKFITTHGLYKAELVVAAPVAWQSQITQASWKDMALLPWVYPKAYCPFHSIVDKTFKSEHISYQQAVTSDDDTTKLELVSAGIGLALLERTEADEAAQEGKIAIWQRRSFKCELSWAYLKNRSEDPLIKALTEDVLKVWEENRGQN
ncbi:MAG TPA: LysR family transcriptional regulator [Candidatus Paceibacterota bacterium]